VTDEEIDSENKNDRIKLPTANTAYALATPQNDALLRTNRYNNATVAKKMAAAKIKLSVGMYMNCILFYDLDVHCSTGSNVPLSQIKYPPC
jgi:hypothetical protein